MSRTTPATPTVAGKVVVITGGARGIGLATAGVGRAVGMQGRPGLVDAALALAPALPPAPQRARLRDLLVQGHCATEALGQVQDPINRQTLLVLVGRLGRC